MAVQIVNSTADMLTYQVQGQQPGRPMPGNWTETIEGPAAGAILTITFRQGGQEVTQPNIPDNYRVEVSHGLRVDMRPGR